MTGSPTETVFQYPSRLEAGFLLVLIALEIGGSLYAAAILEEPLLLGLSGLVALGLGILVARRIWDQRLLRIRALTGELLYLRRTPFHDSQEAHPISDLSAVVVARQTAPYDDDSEPRFALYVDTLSGIRIFLGRASRVAAVNQARRLAGLLNLPLRIPRD